MKVWKIWGNDLPYLYIEADTFDEALKKAREINKKYNTGQLQDKCNEYDNARR